MLPLCLLLTPPSARAAPARGQFPWTQPSLMWNHGVLVKEGEPPQAGPPRTSLLPFQLWGNFRENLMLARGALSPFPAGMPLPNLAAFGMHGLMRDAAKKMEAKRPAAAPELPDPAKLWSAALSRRAQQLIDTSPFRLGDTEKPPMKPQAGQPVQSSGHRPFGTPPGFAIR